MSSTISKCLGWKLNDLFDKTLRAMQSCEAEIREELAAIER